MSRINSADIIRTQYADEIEWLSNNVPFYKVRIEQNILKLTNLMNFFRVVYYFWVTGTYILIILYQR